MKNETIPMRVIKFYAEGFRSMTIGRTLWLIIIIKLMIMFCILKPIFFPRFLGQFKDETLKQEYVSDELIKRAINP
ncbi:MAG: DUF4492 domain-containing protein [Tannerellaceae bacterium]|jgi:hypothetical protein|nr:DUF4492 domain-containing protein [Tannerellaceae bacterium]